MGVWEGEREEGPVMEGLLGVDDIGEISWCGRAFLVYC